MPDANSQRGERALALPEAEKTRQEGIDSGTVLLCEAPSYQLLQLVSLFALTGLVPSSLRKWVYEILHRNVSTRFTDTVARQT